MSEKARWFLFGLIVAGLIAWFDSQLEQSWLSIALTLFIAYAMGIQLGKMAYYVGFYESWGRAWAILAAVIAEVLAFTKLATDYFDATFVAQAFILLLLCWAIVFVTGSLTFNKNVMVENTKINDELSQVTG